MRLHLPRSWSALTESVVRPLLPFLIFWGSQGRVPARIGGGDRVVGRGASIRLGYRIGDGFNDAANEALAATAGTVGCRIAARGRGDRGIVGLGVRIRLALHRGDGVHQAPAAAGMIQG